MTDTCVGTSSAIIRRGAMSALVAVSQDCDMDLGPPYLVVMLQTSGTVPIHLNGRLCDSAGHREVG